MDELKRQEIKILVESLWDSHPDKSELASFVMLGYIFGPYGTNEHYNIDDVYAIVLEVQAEKNPVEPDPLP